MDCINVSKNLVTNDEASCLMSLVGIIKSNEKVLSYWFTQHHGWISSHWMKETRSHTPQSNMYWLIPFIQNSRKFKHRQWQWFPGNGGGGRVDYKEAQENFWKVMDKLSILTVVTVFRVYISLKKNQLHTLNVYNDTTFFICWLYLNNAVGKFFF